MSDLAARMIFALFYNGLSASGRPGLLCAEMPMADEEPHRNGLTAAFYSYEKNMDLHLLVYSACSYPLVAVSWQPRFTDVDNIREWWFLSKHDASVRESLRLVFKAVDEIGISSLGDAGNQIGATEFSKESTEHFRTLTYDRSLKTSESTWDYLIGKHLPNRT